MKRVRLVFMRLAGYPRKNKAIFALFIIGSLLSAIMFAYMYGNLRPILSRYNLARLDYREYSVFFDVNWEESSGGGIILNPPNDNHVTNDMVESIIETGLFESIVLKSFYSMRSNDTPANVCTCVYGSPDQLYISVGVKNLADDNQIIIDADSGKSIGRSITVRGKDFTVVGRFQGSECYLVTMNAYREMNANTNVISVISVDRWHDDNDVPLHTLSLLFPEAVVVSGHNESYDAYISEQTTPGIIVSFAVAFIAFVFLLSYLANQFTEENAVSIIVGGRPIDIALSVMFEGTIFSLLSVFTGLIVHFVLYKPLFNHINIANNMVYKLSDYVEMLIIMTIVVIIMMTALSIKYLLLTPKKLRNKSK